MGKSDKKRAGNKIDEQQTLAQGYLTGLQPQLAGQYGNLYSNYFGSSPFMGNTFGYGSTVPHFSWSGSPYFSGNGTGTPTAPIAGGQPSRYSSQDVRSKLTPYLQSLGAASPEALTRGMAGIQKMFPGAYQEDSDEIVIPGYGRVDVGGGFEGAGPKSWGFLSQADRIAKGQSLGEGMNRGFGGGIMGRQLGDYSNIMNQYQNWANTGGLSEQDAANLRARAISPIRGVYERGRQDLDRQKALQGGYSPGYTTALGRFNREQGQLTSDATTNAEAAIAEMRRQGKMFGMGGMSSLYGATPGLANTFGNQALSAMGQQLQMGGLQNQLSNMLMQAQMNQGQMKGFDWGNLAKWAGAAALAIPTGGASLAAPIIASGAAGGF